MHDGAPTQMKPYIQYLPETANVILEFSGRGSFIAPAVGFLHYGPSCYLYDHVCNFNYQGGERSGLLVAHVFACAGLHGHRAHHAAGVGSACNPGVGFERGHALQSRPLARL